MPAVVSTAWVLVGGRSAKQSSSITLTTHDNFPAWPLLVTEDHFVFLLSSKAGGCGLNLIGGNRLVL